MMILKELGHLLWHHSNSIISNFFNEVINLIIIYDENEAKFPEEG